MSMVPSCWCVETLSVDPRGRGRFRVNPFSAVPPETGVDRSALPVAQLQDQKGRYGGEAEEMTAENSLCEVAADRVRIGAGAETHGVGKHPEQGERDRNGDQHEGERISPARVGLAHQPDERAG